MMKHGEYTENLNALRKEYADAIRSITACVKDDYALIAQVEAEASEYRHQVQSLIEKYRHDV